MDRRNQTPLGPPQVAPRTGKFSTSSHSPGDRTHRKALEPPKQRAKTRGAPAVQSALGGMHPQGGVFPVGSLPSQLQQSSQNESQSFAMFDKLRNSLGDTKSKKTMISSQQWPRRDERGLQQELARHMHPLHLGASSDKESGRTNYNSYVQRMRDKLSPGRKATQAAGPLAEDVLTVSQSQIAERDASRYRETVSQYTHRGGPVFKAKDSTRNAFKGFSLTGGDLSLGPSKPVVLIPARAGLEELTSRELDAYLKKCAPEKRAALRKLQQSPRHCEKKRKELIQEIRQLVAHSKQGDLLPQPPRPSPFENRSQSWINPYRERSTWAATPQIKMNQDLNLTQKAPLGFFQQDRSASTKKVSKPGTVETRKYLQLTDVGTTTQLLQKNRPQPESSSALKALKQVVKTHQMARKSVDQSGNRSVNVVMPADSKGSKYGPETQDLQDERVKSESIPRIGSTQGPQGEETSHLQVSVRNLVDEGAQTEEEGTARQEKIGVELSAASENRRVPQVLNIFPSSKEMSPHHSESEPPVEDPTLSDHKPEFRSNVNDEEEAKKRSELLLRQPTNPSQETSHDPQTQSPEISEVPGDSRTQQNQPGTVFFPSGEEDTLRTGSKVLSGPTERAGPLDYNVEIDHLPGQELAVDLTKSKQSQEWIQLHQSSYRLSSSLKDNRAGHILYGTRLGDFSFMSAQAQEGAMAASNLIPAPLRPPKPETSRSPPRDKQRAFNEKIEKKDRLKKEQQHKKFMANHSIIEKVVESKRQEKSFQEKPREPSPASPVALNLELKNIEDIKNWLTGQSEGDNFLNSTSRVKKKHRLHFKSRASSNLGASVLTSSHHHTSMTNAQTGRFNELKAARELEKKLTREEARITEKYATACRRSPESFRASVDSEIKDLSNLKPLQIEPSPSKLGCERTSREGRRAELDRCQELLRLYTSTLRQFGSEVFKRDKAPQSFFSSILSRIDTSFETAFRAYDKVAQEARFLQTETENLVRTTILLQGQVRALKESEATYLKITEDARRSDESFKDRFAEAQSFLESQKFSDVVKASLFPTAPDGEPIGAEGDPLLEIKRRASQLMKREKEKEKQQRSGSFAFHSEGVGSSLKGVVDEALEMGVEALLLSSENKVKEAKRKECLEEIEATAAEDLLQLFGGEGLVSESETAKLKELLEQPRGFSDYISKLMNKKMQKLQFSGVTNRLDDIHIGLRTQYLAQQAALGNQSFGPYLGGEEAAFNRFSFEMQHRFSHFQHETARKVLCRLPKEPETAEVAAQVEILKLQKTGDDKKVKRPVKKAEEPPTVAEEVFKMQTLKLNTAEAANEDLKARIEKLTKEYEDLQKENQHLKEEIRNSSVRYSSLQNQAQGAVLELKRLSQSKGSRAALGGRGDHIDEIGALGAENYLFDGGNRLQVAPTLLLEENKKKKASKSKKKGYGRKGSSARGRKGSVKSSTRQSARSSAKGGKQEVEEVASRESSSHHSLEEEPDEDDGPDVESEEVIEVPVADQRERSETTSQDIESSSSSSPLPRKKKGSQGKKSKKNKAEIRVQVQTGAADKATPKSMKPQKSPKFQSQPSTVKRGKKMADERKRQNRQPSVETPSHEFELVVARHGGPVARRDQEGEDTPLRGPTSTAVVSGHSGLPLHKQFEEFSSLAMGNPNSKISRQLQMSPKQQSGTASFQNKAVGGSPQMMVSMSGGADGQSLQDTHLSSHSMTKLTQKYGQPRVGLNAAKASFPASPIQVQKVAHRESLKLESSTQTEPAMLFYFVLDFLRELESQIASGEIFKNFNPFSSYDTNSIALEVEVQRSQARVAELQGILKRISAFRNGVGDVFFNSLIKQFNAAPVMAPLHRNRNDKLDLYKEDASGFAYPGRFDFSQAQSKKSKKRKNHSNDDRAQVMLLGYPRHILDFKCEVPTSKAKNTTDTKESLKLSEAKGFEQRPDDMGEFLNPAGFPGTQYDSRAVVTGNAASHIQSSLHQISAARSSLPLRSSGDKNSRQDSGAKHSTPMQLTGKFGAMSLLDQSGIRIMESGSTVEKEGLERAEKESSNHHGAVLSQRQSKFPRVNADLPVDSNYTHQTEDSRATK